MEWLVIAKAVLTVAGSLSVVVVPWLARQLSGRTAQVQEAEDTAAKIAEGLKYIEAAVDVNKLAAAGKTGQAITDTLRTYGPVAVAAVDQARDLAHQLGEEAWKAQEAELRTREDELRRKELADRAALVAQQAK